MAITDRREIGFDMGTVRQALQWSPNSAQAFGLPPLVPTAIRAKPVDGTVEVTYGELTSTRVFALRAEGIAAILIAYWKRIGMPMPRNASKQVRVEQNRVVIVFALRMADTPFPDAPEATVARVPESIRAWSWMEASS